jgi:hypothetical protein
LVVVVATTACCASVLISTPIDLSSYARSILSSQPVASTAPLTLDARTPESALASWFTAVQTADVPAVLRLTTESAQRSVGRMARRSAIRVVGGALGRPSTIQVERHGSRASVRLLVLGYVSASAGPVSAEPLLIALAHTRKGWQIANLSYLMSSAHAIRALAQKGG